jgi:hypothetical protein
VFVSDSVNRMGISAPPEWDKLLRKRLPNYKGNFGWHQITYRD